MPEQPAHAELHRWHRRFAVDANNRAWTLSEKAVLAPEERSELLHAAHAAAYHWSKIGTTAQIAHADLLLGRVHALLGHGESAMTFATEALDAIGSREAEPWEAAFAHAILADAAAASGRTALHAEHYAKAKALGGSLADPQERAQFLATFALVPAPR
jgi:hypothetical protein